MPLPISVFMLLAAVILVAASMPVPAFCALCIGGTFEVAAFIAAGLSDDQPRVQDPTDGVG